jgi:hypothetical protein
MPEGWSGSFLSSSEYLSFFGGVCNAFSSFLLMLD